MRDGDDGKRDKRWIMRMLNWAYDVALKGVPKAHLCSVEDFADNYRSATETPDQSAKRLVRWQVAKAGATGFVTGLGGILTIPVTVPADVAAMTIVQLRMIAAVARLGGHDVHCDEVRTLAYACLCGTSAGDVIKGTSIKLGVKLSEQAVTSISGKTLTQINQRVGFRLLTKFGQKGIVNLGKMIPIAGGVVGGTLDAGATYAVGRVARRMFTP
jgi:uncharacterized protein (DUF697 family)